MTYWTVYQAAAALRVHPCTVYRLIAVRAIKAKRAPRWAANGDEWEIVPVVTGQLTDTSTIADAMGWSSRYVRGMCRRGILKSVKVGRQWRIPIDEAARLMLARFEGPK